MNTSIASNVDVTPAVKALKFEMRVGEVVTLTYTTVGDDTIVLNKTIDVLLALDKCVTALRRQLGR
jgi:hypothetical protein